MSLLWTVTMGWYRLRPHHSNWLCIALQDVSRMPQAQHLSTLVVDIIRVDSHFSLSLVKKCHEYDWLCSNLMKLPGRLQDGHLKKKTILLAFSKHLGPPTVSIRCTVLVSCTWPSSQSQAMMDHGLTIHGLRVSFMGIYLEYIHRLIYIYIYKLYIYILHFILYYFMI
jgi:hypothetical protein